MGFMVVIMCRKITVQYCALSELEKQYQTIKESPPDTAACCFCWLRKMSYLRPCLRDHVFTENAKVLICKWAPKRYATTAAGN